LFIEARIPPLQADLPALRILHVLFGIRLKGPATLAPSEVINRAAVGQGGFNLHPFAILTTRNSYGLKPGGRNLETRFDRPDTGC
jgi:hypothetical protein